MKNKNQMIISTDTEEASSKYQYFSWKKLSQQIIEGTYIKIAKVICEKPIVNIINDEKLEDF